MKIFEKLDSFFAKIESLLLVFLLILMISLSFGQVILRNFFQQGILWADILLRQLVLWVGFLGASLAVRENRHIAIDFLPNVLPSAIRPALINFTQLAAGIISGFLAWAAFKFVEFEREGQSTLFLDIPVWMFQTILPISFFLIACRFFLKVFSPTSTSINIP